MRTVRQTGVLAALSCFAFLACATIAGIDNPNRDTTPTTEQPSGEETTATGLKVSPTVIPLPDYPCGINFDPFKLTLENGSEGDIVFELVAPDDQPFLVGADGAGRDQASKRAVGTVKRKSKLLVDLYTETTRPGKYSAELTLTTSRPDDPAAPAAPVTLRPSALISGGVLTYSLPVVDFGEVRQNTAVTDITVELTNTGNKRISIPQWGGNKGEFDIGDGSPIVLDQGKTLAVPVKFKSGPQSAPLTGEFIPIPDEYICGGPPSLQARGQRVNLEVTVTPSSLQLPDVNCGNLGGGTRTVEIHNFGSGTAQVQNVRLSKNPSPFEFTVPNSSVGAGQTMLITVTAKAVDGNPVQRTDTLSLRTVDSGGSPRDVSIPIALNVFGAVIEVTPTEINNAHNWRSYSVRNNGNRFFNLRHNLVGGQSGSFDFTTNDVFPGETALGAGSTRSPQIRIKDSAAPGTYSTTVDIQPFDNVFQPPNGVLCNPPLPQVEVSGTKNP